MTAKTAVPQSLIDLLHTERCSCVIGRADSIVICRERGVMDLLRLLEASPCVLDGACVADKVVGKGAAALMILGGVSAVFADVISRAALELLADAGIPVGFGECVDAIINRAGTGVCPVETLCRDCATADECLPLIKDFVRQLIKT